MDSSIDALYGGFAQALPPALRPLALDLPHALGLAPVPGVSWSRVFSHEVTLSAPGMIAEAFPGVAPELVRLATLAHSLSVIEAFGTDRVADGQVNATQDLYALLEQLRVSRDSVLERLRAGTAKHAHAADAETRAAVHQENALLSRLEAASFEDYRRISLAKQAVGFPASLALAGVAGADKTQLEIVQNILSGVALGLQFEDDAGDWEDDWRRGHGAWAVSLARRKLELVKTQEPDERPTEPDLIRRRVFSMKVLHSMLLAARHEYQMAWRSAQTLGAKRLADWAEQRTAKLDELLPLEERHAGYVVRARKLAAWASEVLS